MASSSLSAPKSKGWIAVDLDGTLAHYDARHGVAVIGKAIDSTVLRVKQWLDRGIDVRIFTARAADKKLIPSIQDWLEKNALPRLPVTNLRDYDLMQVWDDRVVQVETNTGEVLTSKRYVSLDAAGWIGVELDGTLAHYENEQPLSAIGQPVSKMKMRVQQWLMAGIDVRLFTARAADAQQLPIIERWLKEHRLDKMKITHQKDFAMSQFWDDRGIHVVSNTGEIVAPLNTLTPQRKYPV